MTLPASFSSYIIVKATKVDKKDIKRFYRNQRYGARYIGQDQCYLVKINNIIVACAIISSGQENGHFWLLHGLVTDKAHRHKGIAGLLLRTIMSEREATQNKISLAAYPKIICFADNALSSFYLKNYFIRYNHCHEIALLPFEFKQRLTRYREKQTNLHCFLYSANVALSA